MSTPNSATPAPKLTDHDPMPDFERRDIVLLGQTKRVFVSGNGPAVIVMAEMPGIYAHVVRFARFVRDARFTVWMPALFGTQGGPRPRHHGQLRCHAHPHLHQPRVSCIRGE